MQNGVDHEQTKKELILNTTIELIRDEGFEGLTIRKIAKLARVNIGLVNYYFGSKDKLINVVTQRLVQSFKESFAILDNDHIPPRERLKKFLIQYVISNEKYPYIVRRLIHEKPIMFDSHLEFMNFIKAIGLEKVQKTIQELSGENDRERLTIMTSHLLGALLFPSVIETLYEKVTGYDFPEMETRVDILLERYFPEPD